MVRASADVCDLYQIITSILKEHATIQEIDAVVSDVTNCHGGCPTSRHEFQIRLNEDAKWRYISLILSVKAGATPYES